MEKRFITQASINRWLTKIVNDGKHLYAPVKKGDRVDFGRATSADDIVFDHIQTTQSAKSVAFPRTDVLFSYEKEKGKVQLENADLTAYPETVVFGLHPCDAAGFNPLGAIFNWDYKDEIYNARLQRTVVVTLACTKADEYCFCTSVNGGPGNTAGSDIQLTPVKDGFLAEILTEKGEALMKADEAAFEADRGDVKEEFLVKLPEKFDVKAVQEKLQTAFESPIWKAQSQRCIGCGACAYVCPTCACFDIQEDAHGTKGKRLRCWDSCGFALFTLHTSGHNPRQTQAQRWRQRLLHKFSYMPDRLSVRGCTGCGRCSRACPVDMNLSEHLSSI
ncbi:4Fe-4S dicluster domain-containing protein [Paludibacter sp.]|uniref:4Fe-4S dicluster domain-containing protein n=1 Tax=Paludibacter sp. TaxID=1898105 RepID=UPI00135347C2|nr:4Fe-4S dicluster domain-containing protein [Paludibacter sp.]MTK53822.1 hydrogenase subunit beta [Paludibacter sp.]